MTALAPPIEFAVNRARHALPVGPLTRTERGQVIAVLTLGDGWTAARIARALGVHVSTVERQRPATNRRHLHPLPDGLVTTREAANRLGVCDLTVRNWIVAGKLPGRRHGSREWCVPVKAIGAVS